jgi:NAD(P)-dependent dehydrogenase (short-subunit alcohol dehydrogenase family)
LNGRVALVTGGGCGAGEGIVIALARSGATVVVCDLDPKRAERVADAVRLDGGAALPIVFDVTDYDAVRAGVREAEAAAGPIDILVNNVGMPRERLQAPFASSTPEQWRPFIEINIYGSLYCMRTVLPAMCSRGWGRIVQISSGAAARGLPPAAGYTALGAAKAGIEGAVRHIAVEVAGSGVTVNTVALGQMENAVEHAKPEVIAMVRAQTPVGRPGRPEEAGAAVAWLCSPEGGFVTGQVIHLNGGSYQGR